MQSSLTTFLKKQNVFANLEFRRVDNIIYKSNKEKIHQYSFDTDTDSFITEEVENSNFTDAEIEHSIGFANDDFTFITTPYSFRKHSSGNESKWNGNVVLCKSKNFAQFSFKTFRFERGNNRNVYLPRLKRSNPENRKQTLQADLIACIPILTKNGVEAKFWCYVSEQFLRLWTLIFFENDVSLFKGNDFANSRKWLFTGNRLQCNAFMKWIKAHRQNNEEYSIEEMYKRFYFNRTEEECKYVHFYCMLALIIRYNEFPNENNMPINLGKRFVDGVKVPELNMKYWDYPEELFFNILTKSGIEITEDMKESLTKERVFVEDTIIQQEKINENTQEEKTFEIDNSNFPSL